MKHWFITLLLKVSLLLCHTAYAQTMIQQQDRDRINTEAFDHEQARLEIRERLQIDPVSETGMQNRMNIQNQQQFVFADMQQHWAGEDVGRAYLWGIAGGFPDGRFYPEEKLTGLQGVLMVNRLMNCVDGIEPGPNYSEADIDWDMIPEWARETMREQTALRIAVQSAFYGEEQLNRLQFAIMLAKGLGLEPLEIEEGVVVFGDQKDISQEGLGYVMALTRLGLIAGDGGNFYPNRAVTRAEATVMLMRVLDMID